MVASEEPSFKIEHLSVSYISRGVPMHAVKDFSLTLEQNESVGLLGESGAGKSTVGWALIGMIEKPNRATGHILFGDRDVLQMTDGEMKDFRWKDVSMIFQSSMSTLDPLITVGQSMADLLIHKGVCKSKAEARALSLQTLELLDLGETTMDAFPHQLSGGIKQRVAIAMAIATGPTVLVADEPTTALDTINQASILKLMKKLREEKKIKSIIFISHDISVHAFMADRLIVMFRGRAIEEGKTKDLIKNPQHPYTRLLMSSISLGAKKETVKLGASSVESPEDACPYMPFCPYAMAECSKSFPEPREVSEGHVVSCYLYGANKP